MKPTYYITTPIFYASGKIQIGNTYTAILADAIARYKKITNHDVIFQTGMDEHGQKVQQKAEENNQNPKQFVDQISKEVQNILKLVNVDYDRFIRTTDPNHKEVVQKIFQKLYDKKDIYKGKYEGLYCTPCESFFTKSQLIDGKCPDCHRPVHQTSEEAYFLNLKKYESWLKEYIITHEDFIVPASRKKEMLNFIDQGLDDLCISRTSFDWGIKVPFDDKHVIYVWLDALTNYITFNGYLKDEETFNKYWPANLHVVGKDILRFHSIYWPIMLKALDLPLPKQILAHPFFVDSKGEKMSKSKGNTLYPDQLVEQFTADPIRYYLLSELGLTHDGNIGIDLIIDRYNASLANTLGNLVNRTITMVYKYNDGIVKKPVQTKEDEDLINSTLNLKNKIEEKMNQLKISESLSLIFEIYEKCNKYIDQTSPWTLAKDKTNQEKLDTVLYNLLESIRIATIFLSPFMPETAKKIFNQLNTKKTNIETTTTFNGMEEGIKLNKPEVLFQRINKEEKLKELNK